MRTFAIGMETDAIDPKLKMNTYDMGKYLLRRAFEKDKLLPEEILWRQKAAFSDAAGRSTADGLKGYAEQCYEGFFARHMSVRKMIPAFSRLRARTLPRAFFPLQKRLGFGGK